MSKRSAGQAALDKIDAEIEDLQRVRGRLIEAIEIKPQRVRKPKAEKLRPVGADVKVS